MRSAMVMALDLVVRDIEDGGAQLLLDALELEPHIGAQFASSELSGSSIR